MNFKELNKAVYEKSLDLEKRIFSEDLCQDGLKFLKPNRIETEIYLYGGILWTGYGLLGGALIGKPLLCATICAIGSTVGSSGYYILSRLSESGLFGNSSKEQQKRMKSEGEGIYQKWKRMNKLLEETK